jgi:fructose-1,6-bisphosphatase
MFREEQQKLDVIANEIFITALSQREVVCGIASEENDDFIDIKCGENGHLSKYVVLIDPLDGSSNIDVNVSVGTIFLSTEELQNLEHLYSLKISYRKELIRLQQDMLSTVLPQ